MNAPMQPRTALDCVRAIVLNMVLAWLQVSAAEWHETFSTDPMQRGWAFHGDASLFTWDSTRENLSATWDSQRTNTFFHRPLGTVLTRSDPFRFSFRIQLDEIRTDPDMGTFQLAVGLLRRERAFEGSFLRGSGVHPVTGPRDLVEFNYFPAGGAISPTFAAVVIGTNNLRWATLHVFPVELVTGQTYEISVNFDPVDQSLQLKAYRDLELVALESHALEPGVADFRVDAFSVTSYSGAGQPANYAGTLFARGWVDDIVVRIPDPPHPSLQIAGAGVAKLSNQYAAEGWIPFLERSLGNGPGPWETIPATVQVEGSHWVLKDSHPPSNQGIYRVRLERP